MRPLPGTASVGLRFDLLALSAACPQHTYAPGPNLHPLVHVLVLALTAVALAACVALLRDTAIGVWMVAVLAAVRLALLGAGLRFSPPSTPYASLTPWRPQVVRPTRWLVRPLSRRGPPLPC